MRPLELKQDEDWPQLYRARYKAPHTGNFHIFANDAQLPFGAGRSLYENNCGTALVTATLVRSRRPGEPKQEFIREPTRHVKLPACAARRAVEAEE